MVGECGSEWLERRGGESKRLVEVVLEVIDLREGEKWEPKKIKFHQGSIFLHNVIQGNDSDNTPQLLSLLGQLKFPWANP